MCDSHYCLIWITSTFYLKQKKKKSNANAMSRKFRLEMRFERPTIKLPLLPVRISISRCQTNKEFNLKAFTLMIPEGKQKKGKKKKLRKENCFFFPSLFSLKNIKKH